MFNELDLHASVITESWLRPGLQLEEDLRDLDAGTNITLIHKSRPAKRGRTAGGGVVIAYNKNRLKLKERKMVRGKAELVCAVGKLPGASRKVVIIGVYLPPQTKTDKVQETMQYIRDEIYKVKNEYEDPYIIVSGDFNKKETSTAFADFVDIEEADAGPTRKNEALDLTFINFKQEVTSKSIRPPLSSPNGSKVSDHKVVSICAELKAGDRFKWIRYSARPRTQAGNLKIAELMDKESWKDVIEEPCANNKATKLVERLDAMMNEAFPEKQKKIKSTEDPWITDHIRKQITDRKKIYNKQDRSPDWKKMKAFTNKLIKDSKHEYYANFTKKAIETKDSRLYYQVVNRLKSTEKPK